MAIISLQTEITSIFTKFKERRMSIIEQVKNELLRRNQEYIEKVDSYDFWENHIKFVLDEALKLASIYGANKEIVELGAILHDIALVSNVGTKADHHTNGAKSPRKS